MRSWHILVSNVSMPILAQTRESPSCSTDDVHGRTG